VLRSGALLAINGRCLIEFRLVDATHGRFVPSVCDYVDSTGVPVRAEFISGDLQLDGDELSYTLSDRVADPTYCDFGVSTFVGLRR
jgi:hypothetical protein